MFLDGELRKSEMRSLFFYSLAIDY